MRLEPSPLIGAVSGVIGGHRVVARTLPPAIVIPHRAPHQAMLAPGPANTCPCESWQQADAMWVAATPETRALWSQAATMPGITGYNYWMAWHLFCFNLGRNAPDYPPGSGGWSYHERECSGGHEPPVVCLPEPPPPPWPPGERCPHCWPLTPKYLSVTIIDFAGDLAPVNGVWLLPQGEGYPCHYTYAEELWNCDLEFWDLFLNLFVLDVAGLAACFSPLDAGGNQPEDCGSGDGGGFFPRDQGLCPIPEEWYDVASYTFVGSEP